MQAGKLRHKITIQQKVVTQDQDTGEMTEAWNTFKSVWASVEPLSVREFIAADKINSEVNARIVIRYMAGIKHDMRILFRDKIYNIAGILTDAKSGFEYITMPVSEGVNNG